MNKKSKKNYLLLNEKSLDDFEKEVRQETLKEVWSELNLLLSATSEDKEIESTLRVYFNEVLEEAKK